MLKKLQTTLLLMFLLSGSAICAENSWYCEQNNIFKDGQEGTTPVDNPVKGPQLRNTFIAGVGNQSYYIYVPYSYTSNQPTALLIALHGAAGPGNAPVAAQSVRNSWAQIAENERVIVIAQIATGPTSGSWIPFTAEAIMDTLIVETASEYNIDLNKLYGWGFSAGGHVMHEFALRRANEFAAYAVSAGVLAGYAGTNMPLLAARNIPVDIHVGNSDSLLIHAQADWQRFINAGWSDQQNLQLSVFTGPHIYTSSHLQEMWDFMCAFEL